VYRFKNGDYVRFKNHPYDYVIKVLDVIDNKAMYVEITYPPDIKVGHVSHTLCFNNTRERDVELGDPMMYEKWQLYEIYNSPFTKL
jgi:hypothetical protein